MTTLAISSSLSTSNITGALLHDRAQATGARAAGERLVGDRLDGILGELQDDAIDLEHLLVLLDGGVARLGEDAHERGGVEGATVVMTGRRPMNSGMSPNFARSSGMTSWMLSARSFGVCSSEPKPSPFALRDSMRLRARRTRHRR